MFFDDKLQQQPINEVYFGKTPEILSIEKQLDKLRNKYMGRYLNIKGVNNDPDLLKFDRMMEKQFGLGCFTLHIINEPVVNGYTIPIDYCIDADRTGKDIMVDKNTFKFKKEFDYALFMCSYSGVLFNPNFSTGECMALILHEVGHNFNSALNKKNGSLTNLYITSSYIVGIIDTIVNVILALTGKIPILNMGIPSNNADIKVQQEIDKEMRKKKPNSISVRFQDIFSDINSTIATVFGGIGNLIRVGTMGLSTVVSAIFSKTISVLFSPLQSLFMPVKYKSERTADNFPTMYGYGPENISLQAKLDSEVASSPDAIMNKIDKIPLISTLLHTVELPAIILVTALDEHPEGVSRCLDQLALLKREVNKEDLDPKMKKVLLSDIKECEKQINKLTDITKGIKDPYLARKIYNKYLFKIDGDLKHNIMDDKNKFDEYDKKYDALTK